jgi:tetratricopeptide (TPR) repeat protein
MDQADPTSRTNDREKLVELRTAVRRAPEDAAAWAQLVGALHRLGRHTAVLQVNARALALAPANPVLWSIQAMALMGTDRYVEALAAFDRVTQLTPEDPVAWLQKATALFAVHRHAPEQLEQALACFDRALAIAPDYARAWLNKSLTLTVLDRRDEARAARKHAKALGAWDEDRHAWVPIDDARFKRPWLS